MEKGNKQRQSEFMIQFISMFKSPITEKTKAIVVNILAICFGLKYRGIKKAR